MSYFFVFCAISALILLHEAGHFLAAKWTGIPVARFSIGFGSRLWGFRRGRTEYWLSYVPFGGYVLPAVENVDEFEALPLKKRLWFAIGGPAANVIGAFVCLSIVNVAAAGISFEAAVTYPLSQIGQTALDICRVIPAIFTHPDRLSGVVGIVAAGGQHVGTSTIRLLELCFLLNVNLAVFNLLPFPPLDGGKILMGILQWIYDPLRRLHVPLAITGWALLACLMIYVTVMDVHRMASGVGV